MSGGFLASSFDDGLHSTYICPLVLGEARRVLAFNVLCVILDTLLLIGAGGLSRKEIRSRGRRETQICALWGCGFLVSPR